MVYTPLSEYLKVPPGTRLYRASEFLSADILQGKNKSNELPDVHINSDGIVVNFSLKLNDSEDPPRVLLSPSSGMTILPKERKCTKLNKFGCYLHSGNIFKQQNQCCCESESCESDFDCDSDCSGKSEHVHESLKKTEQPKFLGYESTSESEAPSRKVTELSPKYVKKQLTRVSKPPEKYQPTIKARRLDQIVKKKESKIGTSSMYQNKTHQNEFMENKPLKKKQKDSGHSSLAPSACARGMTGTPAKPNIRTMKYMKYIQQKQEQMLQKQKETFDDDLFSQIATLKKYKNCQLLLDYSHETSMNISSFSSLKSPNVDQKANQSSAFTPRTSLLAKWGVNETVSISSPNSKKKNAFDLAITPTTIKEKSNVNKIIYNNRLKRPSKRVSPKENEEKEDKASSTGQDLAHSKAKRQRQITMYTIPESVSTSFKDDSDDEDADYYYT